MTDFSAKIGAGNLDPMTLGSASEAFDVSGCFYASLYVRSGAGATTAPVIKLQIAAVDNPAADQWFDTAASVTADASANKFATSDAFVAKKARIVVATAGVAAVVNSVKVLAQ